MQLFQRLASNNVELLTLHIPQANHDACFVAEVVRASLCAIVIFGTTSPCLPWSALWKFSHARMLTPRFLRTSRIGVGGLISDIPACAMHISLINIRQTILACGKQLGVCIAGHLSSGRQPQACACCVAGSKSEGPCRRSFSCNLRGVGARSLLSRIQRERDDCSTQR